MLRSKSSIMFVLAPIVLFVYNRPVHTRRTLEALQASDLADKSILYIFSDAPKKGDHVGSEMVRAVRELIKESWRFKHVYIIEQEQNKGLANSVIDGVSHLLDTYDQVIVLEDDLLISKYGIRYFNDALRKYADDELIMHISGYMYPVMDSDRLPETFLFRVPASWGWATWKRAWKNFNPNISQLIENFTQKDQYQLSVEGSENYWKQVKEFTSDKIDSWAIRWYLSMYQHRGMALYPRSAHIQNIGTDGSGTHSDQSAMYHVELADTPTAWFTDERTENVHALRSIKHFYKHRKGSIIRRIKRLLIKKWKNLG